MAFSESYHPGVGQLGQAESLRHVDAGCSTPVFCWFLPGDTRHDQQGPGGRAPAAAQHSLNVTQLRFSLTCETRGRCWRDKTTQPKVINGSSKRLETERQPYLTSPRLGVGHINKPVHHLAHLLDLRSGAVNPAT